jgi:two-component system, sensor histidine kinase and response regulator
MKRSRNTKEEKGKSLLLLINTSFILLNIISICAISIIVFAALQTSIRETIIQLEDNIYESIYDDIDNMITTPLSVNESNKYLIKNGIINMSDSADRQRFLTGMISASIDDISSVCYVTENGTYYGAQRNTTTNRIEYKTYSTTGYTDTTSNYNSKPENLYKDPRTSNWYMIAKNKGLQVFTSPVKNMFSDDLMITASCPIYNDDGALLGVLASHIRLGTLSNSLQSMLQGKLGEGFIIDNNTGNIIANSNGTANYSILADGSSTGIPLSQADDKTITEAYHTYIKTGQGKYFIKSMHKRYYVNINEYTSNDIDWIIITCIPDSILTSAFKNNLYSAAILCLATVFIVILFTFAGSKIILKPIRHLVVTAEQLSKGELTVRAAVFRNDDIGKLALAFNHMADEINNQIITLEDKIHDRTSELATANQALVAAKDQAVASSKYKSRFLANMSHEIRTPLNGIVGFLRLLEETPLNEEQLDYVKTIAGSTDSLLAIINDLLDISKIEAGRMVLEQIPFELIPTIETAIHLFDVKAASKGLEMSINYDARLPEYTLGDPTKLKQIISNLVSNAVKFTDMGTITIRVKLETQFDQTVIISFSIEDTGIGLSQEEIGRLFEPFCQADASSTRKYGGTGLGLAICKNLIEMMQGEINILSIPGEGSVFHFHIMLKKSFKNDSSALHKSIKYDTEVYSFESAGKVSILLVEDNETNISFFTKLMRTKGFYCDLATDGEKALLAYQNKPYHIIFMDCQLPIMDGYESTRRIRAIEGNDRHTPIIALTAYALEEDTTKCLESGMDDVIYKPISIHILEQLLMKYLYTIKSDPQATVDFLTETVTSFMIETDFDYESCMELINDFCDQSLPLMEAIRKAVHRSDKADALILFHKLKGSASTVRAKKLAEIAEVAEKSTKDNDWEMVALLLEEIEYLVHTLKK